MERKTVISKNAFASQIASKCSINVNDVNTILNTLQQVILDNVNNGFGVNLSGFLTFEVIELAQRVGVDSKTGKKIKLPAQKRLNVKVSDSFQKKIKQE